MAPPAGPGGARPAGRLRLLEGDGIAAVGETVRPGDVLLNKQSPTNTKDYAAAAPHVALNMNPRLVGIDRSIAALAYKDAMFISPHKFPGGPGTPGVLVVKKNLLQNAVPSGRGCECAALSCL